MSTVEEVTTRVMTIPQAAAYLGCSDRTVYRLIDTGELRATRVRKVFRVRQEWLDEYLDRPVTA